MILSDIFGAFTNSQSHKPQAARRPNNHQTPKRSSIPTAKVSGELQGRRHPHPVFAASVPWPGSSASSPHRSFLALAPANQRLRCPALTQTTSKGFCLYLYRFPPFFSPSSRLYLSIQQIFLPQAKKPNSCLGPAPLSTRQHPPEMSTATVTGVPTGNAPPKLEKKPVKFSNLLLGAGLNLFEVTTLGQPLEVVKTTMAANRADGFAGAIGRIWARGGVFGFYQGLIPWAWIEASTKGAVLLFVASEAEYYAKTFGAPDFVAGISGGMTGGLAQAYATMGFCTCMKTVEITKHKVAAAGMKPPGTMETFMEIWRKEGIRGINRGVNAVAVRQVTNWGSRFGLSRVAETGIRRVTGKESGEKLSVMEKIIASALGGGLSAWNQPIEVIRVEMQSKTEDPNRPKNLTVGKAAKYIYQNNGLKGLYRGVTPRIGLGVWQTVCMVALGDVAKEAVEKLTGDKVTAKH